MSMRPIAAALIAFLGASCAPDPAEPEAPSAGAGGEEEPTEQVRVPDGADAADRPSAIEVMGISGPEQPWAEMSMDEREFYMIGKVLPITMEIFQEFDALAFEEFGCESCHGDDAEAREFAMPTRSLPPVPAPDTEEWAAMEKDQPRMVRFMREKVTPVTATLLGLEAFDPETGRGFGCNDCHPTP
ncbi:MAG: hypothetical protein ACODAU_02970 [Myxococcota bacterium]